VQLDVIQTGLKEVEADALVLGHWSGAPFGGDLAEVDILLNGAISELAGIDANAEISGKRGELILLHTRGAIAAKRVLVVGLGKRPEADNILLQEASGTAVRFLREKNLTNIASALHRSHRLRGKGSKDAGPDPVKSAEAAVDGAFTAIWEPGSHKTEKSGNSSAERFIVVEPDEGRLEAVTNGAERGRILAESANLARTLVNAPPNDLAPMALAAFSTRMQCSGLAWAACWRCRPVRKIAPVS
jgi:leucyl aminopeptidase